METDARFMRIEAFPDSSATDIAAVSAKQRNQDRSIAEIFKITDAISQGGKTLFTAQVSRSDAQQTMLVSQQRMADHFQTIFQNLTDGQQRFEDALEKFAEAQRRTEGSMNVFNVKSAETQGKLDALIHTWDDWIRDNGGRNG